MRKKYLYPLFATMLLTAAFLPVGAVSGESLPDGIVVKKNIPYVTGGGPRQQLDLYFPNGHVESTESYPLIVIVHGGAWSGGSKDMRHYMLDGVFKAILESGDYVMAVINYRLTDQGPFPMQLEDCKSAIRWLRAHAKQYKIDPDRVGVWGGSAGGHLVALIGTTGDTHEFDRGEYLDRSSRVQAVCDFCGSADLELVVGNPYYQSIPHINSIRAFLGKPIREARAEARRACPMTYITKKSSPFLLVHGTDDPVNPMIHSERLKAALDKAGVPCTLDPLPATAHDGPLFVAPQTMSTMMRFFDRYLKTAENNN